MKQIRIKHEGADIIGSVPEKWSELKVKHFLLLEEDFNEVDFISVFMDVDKATIENTKGDLKPVVKAITNLFTEKPPNFQDAKKESVLLEGKELKFPDKLDFTRFGQKAMLKNIVSNPDGFDKDIPLIFAIYAQPLIDGKFDSTRIDRVKDLVNELPIEQVYPYVVFFFKRLNELKNHFQASLELFPKPPNSLKMKSWLKFQGATDSTNTETLD